MDVKMASNDEVAMAVSMKRGIWQGLGNEGALDESFVDESGRRNRGLQSCRRLELIRGAQYCF